MALALTVVLTLLASHYLTRRLYALAQVARGVQAGQAGLRVKVTGHDEAAQLAQEFSTMLDTLA